MLKPSAASLFLILVFLPPAAAGWISENSSRGKGRRGPVPMKLNSKEKRLAEASGRVIGSSGHREVRGGLGSIGSIGREGEVE